MAMKDDEVERIAELEHTLEVERADRRLNEATLVRHLESTMGELSRARQELAVIKDERAQRKLEAGRYVLTGVVRYDDGEAYRSDIEIKADTDGAAIKRAIEELEDTSYTSYSYYECASAKMYVVTREIGIAEVMRAMREDQARKDKIAAEKRDAKEYARLWEKFNGAKPWNQ